MTNAEAVVAAQSEGEIRYKEIKAAREHERELENTAKAAAADKSAEAIASTLFDHTTVLSKQLDGFMRDHGNDIYGQSSSGKAAERASGNRRCSRRSRGLSR